MKIFNDKLIHDKIVEIFIPSLNDEIFNDVKRKLEEYYQKVQLAICKKCKMLFSFTEEGKFHFNVVKWKKNCMMTKVLIL